MLNGNPKQTLPKVFAMIIFRFGKFMSEATMQEKRAISATVTGDDQKVGFRAMIMKQAIVQPCGVRAE
jgi:hypothetical protein